MVLAAKTTDKRVAYENQRAGWGWIPSLFSILQKQASIFTKKWNSPSLIMVCGFCFWISLGSIPGYPHSLDPCWFFWWCSSWPYDAKWCFQFVFHSCPAIRVDLAFCWFLKLCWKWSRWIWILNFLQKFCQVLVSLFLIFPLTNSHGFDYVPSKGISLTSFISLCFRCVFGEWILYSWLCNCFASLSSLYVTIGTHVSHVKMLKYKSHLWLFRKRRSNTAICLLFYWY